MKIVSVVVFLVALVGSWMAAHSSPPVTEFMHVGIQNDLKNIIAEYVQKNLPSAKNLRFEKFWTETVKKNQVKANFSYSFEDPSAENGEVEVQINGTALLERGEETQETVTWNLNSLQISDNHVDFQEPIHITAGKTPSSPETE